MKKYEYLSHTADAKFRAYGSGKEEAFANAALAMMNVMVDTKEVKAVTKQKISVEGDDLQSLLYNFLEQFLIFLDAENLFLVKVNLIEIKGSGSKGYSLTAEVAGDDAGKYETIGPQVKAITYNDMLINEQNGKWVIQAVIDI